MYIYLKGALLLFGGLITEWARVAMNGKSTKTTKKATLVFFFKSVISLDLIDLRKLGR